MDLPTFNIVSLCAGVGGLDLGLRLAVPDARTVCYVEWNHFAASVIAARAQDGGLDDAPVWDDVGTFDGGPWRGIVDCVVAGFPCQPVSLAGKRAGMADERFIWGDITRIVREVGPRYLFLENVPGILSADAGAFLGRVLGDVAELGFDAEWDVFSAAETGAPHRRERWFLLGVCLADSQRRELRQQHWASRRTPTVLGPTSQTVADAEYRAFTDGPRCEGGAVGEWLPIRRKSGSGCEILADSDHTGRGEFSQSISTRPKHETAKRSGAVYPPSRNDFRRWADLIAADPSVEPAVCRDADGLASGLDASLFTYRADRLRSVGNGVVPLTAALAWTVLSDRLNRR